VSRLRDDLSLLEAIEAMAEGNPGAASVLTELFERKGMGALDSFKALDALGLYGSDIWVAYKDVCAQKIDGLIAVLNMQPAALKDRVAQAKAP
jgi:hypothetical protein